MVTTFVVAAILFAASGIVLLLSIDRCDLLCWRVAMKASGVVCFVCYCIGIWVLWETNCFAPTEFFY